MGMISRADGFMVWLCPHVWSFVAPGFGLSVVRTPLPKSPLRLLAWRWMCWGAEGSRVVSTWAEESWWRWRICREGLELVRKLWPKCWRPSRAGRAAGMARAVLALGRERGVLCLLGVGEEGEKVSPFPQTSPWLPLWLGKGAAESKDALWDVGVPIWPSRWPSDNAAPLRFAWGLAGGSHSPAKSRLPSSAVAIRPPAALPLWCVQPAAL